MSDFYAARALASNPQSKPLFHRALNKAFRALPNKGECWMRDLEDIVECVSNQYCFGDYFDYIAHGAYKEAYRLHRIGNYVVKVCSQQNDTEAEQALFEAAWDEGVGPVFLETQFVNFYGLTCGMPELTEEAFGDSESAEYWNSELQEYETNDDWEGRFGVSLEIQPIIRCTAGEHPNHHYWSYTRAYGEGLTAPDEHTEFDFLRDPVTGEIVPFEVLNKLKITERYWLERFLEWHGLDMLKRLADFVDKYRVSDLHQNNLGYIAASTMVPGAPDDIEIPVILDWMSVTKPAIERIRSLH